MIYINFNIYQFIYKLKFIYIKFDYGSTFM